MGDPIRSMSVISTLLLIFLTCCLLSRLGYGLWDDEEEEKDEESVDGNSKVED